MPVLTGYVSSIEGPFSYSHEVIAADNGGDPNVDYYEVNFRPLEAPSDFIETFTMRVPSEMIDEFPPAAIFELGVLPTGEWVE